MAKSHLRHLLHVFPTFAVGGSQSRFARLVELHGARYRHTVIAIDGVLTMAERMRGGTSVTFLHERFRTNSTVRGAMRAYRMLAQCKPDLLVTYNWGSI